MNIKQATVADIDLVTKKLLLIYEGSNYEDLLIENKEMLNSKSQAFFLAFDNDNCISEDNCIGVVHCSLRYDYVEGTAGGCIGYLEGIYVEPQYRLKGVAKALVQECEKWAVSCGCVEMASDCELDNNLSYDFHINIGYKEANRIICFTKKITQSEE